jgi:hypothetical protein
VVNMGVMVIVTLLRWRRKQRRFAAMNLIIDIWESEQNTEM